MDPVAYLEEKDWETLKSRNPHWNEVNKSSLKICDLKMICSM
jgi:hypothetical protein